MAPESSKRLLWRCPKWIFTVLKNLSGMTVTLFDGLQRNFIFCISHHGNNIPMILAECIVRKKQTTDLWDELILRKQGMDFSLVILGCNQTLQPRNQNHEKFLWFQKLYNITVFPIFVIPSTISNIVNYNTSFWSLLLYH